MDHDCEKCTSRVEESTSASSNHRGPDPRKPSVREPRLPGCFASVPEVREYILAILVNKFDLEHTEAEVIAKKWQMATGGMLRSMSGLELSRVFGEPLGCRLYDIIRYQERELADYWILLPSVIRKIRKQAERLTKTTSAHYYHRHLLLVPTHCLWLGSV